MLCQNTKIGFGNNTVTAVLSEMLLTPLHRYIIDVFMLQAYRYFPIHCIIYNSFPKFNVSWPI